jgi:uncharacterized protein
MRNNKTYLFNLKGSHLMLATLLLFFIACKPSKESKDDNLMLFDKEAMLKHYSLNLILSAYNQCSIQLSKLQQSIVSYKAAPTASAFLAIRAAFDTAYVSYQHCALYEFGPAETIQLRLNMNVFPTDTVQIKNNISNGTYDLNAANNLDAKGFPALDYLLFLKGSNLQSSFNAFANDNLAEKRLQYLERAAQDMQVKITFVNGEWRSNYKNTFNASLDASIGSALGNLINQLNYELEQVKNLKLGIPLGKKTLGVVQPHLSEALYSERSIALLKANLANIENVYYGKNQSGADGLGIDDYIIALNSQYNGSTLSNAIRNQLNAVNTQLATLQSPIALAVVNENAKVNNLYIEIQKLVVLLKSDLPSALGVVITYQDGDGD